MARLDEDGIKYKCDRCGTEYLYNDDNLKFQQYLVRPLFYRRPTPDIPDFCNKCEKDVIPLVHALRDVDELKYYVNKLERAINAKRKQRIENYRATARNAC
jgi:hypothetical protein